MTFELVVKRKQGSMVAIKPMQIAIRKNGFSLGSDIVNSFNGKEFVEIYLDYENKRIGFRAVDNGITGFKSQKTDAKTNTRYLVAKKVTARLNKGLFEAEMEEDMAVIKVPEIAKE